MSITRTALLLAGAALLLASGASRAQMTVTNTAPLDFGSLVPGAAAGTVVIAPAGGRTTTGGVTGVSGTFGPGAFRVSITSGGATFFFFLPGNATLSSGASTMTVSAFTSNPAPNSAAVPGPPGALTLNVGATLAVGANQPPGTYTGTYSIFFIHF
jgi:hypothetical protein